MSLPRSQPIAPGGRIRILLVEWRLGDDGAARSSLRLVSRWQAAGAAVRLFAVSIKAPLPDDVRPTYPTRKVRRLRYVLPHVAARLLSAARASDIVVSGRELGFGLLWARAVARATRRPFAVVIRSEPLAAIESYVEPRWRSANRRALAGADVAICISPGLAPAVRAAGVRADAIRVVMNGLEIDGVVAAGRRMPTALPEGPGPLVVGVGRLERQKGFDVLIRAHARLIADGRVQRLLLLGEGRQRAELEHLIEEFGVRDSVHVAGFVAEPLPFVAAADLFCLPSRWEGFGQSLAEALLLGTPVVAADCVSGPRDLLADGAHGDLVPVDDVDALASAIAHHFDDPQRLRAAAAQGREWATTHLDVDRTALEMLEVLEATVSGAPGVRAP